MPIGMPMIVRHRARPVAMWVSASHQPRRPRPDDVAQERQQAGGGLVDHLAAERPDGVVGHPERGDAPGDGDDQQAAEDAGEHVGDPQPEAAEDEPDEIEQGTHASRVRAVSPRTMRPSRAVPGFQLPCSVNAAYAAGRTARTALRRPSCRRPHGSRRRSGRRRPSATGRCRLRSPETRPSVRSGRSATGGLSVAGRPAARTCPWSWPRPVRRCGSPSGRQAAGGRGHRLPAGSSRRGTCRLAGPALGQDLRAAAAVDGAIHTAAAQRRGVGRVDDGVDLLLGDVASTTEICAKQQFNLGADQRSPR